MSQSLLSESTLGYPEELAIFEKPLQNVGIRRTTKVRYFPTNDFTTQNLIQFSIPNNGNCYIDLKQTMLNISCKIVFKDGSSVQVPDLDGDKGGDNGDEQHLALVAPVNSFLSSIFNRCEVTLQNSGVTSTNESYQYASYIKSLLFTSKDAQESCLGQQMFYRDTPGHFEDTNWLVAGNQGLITRGTFFSASSEVDMCGPLCSDLFQTEKYLPNGVSLGITLYPTSPEFCLLSPDVNPKQFKIVITKASLQMTLVEPSAEILVSHAEVFNTKSAILPYMRTDVRKFGLAKGLHTAEISDPFSSLIPDQLIIGLVSNKASYGSLDENPFFFHHYNLNTIRVTVDGAEMGRGTLETKFADTPEKGLYMEGYESLMGIGDNCQNVCPISRTEYADGNTFYRFQWRDEGESDSDGDVLPLRRTGHLRVFLKFDQQLPEAVSVIMFARFPAAIKIDKNRAVTQV